MAWNRVIDRLTLGPTRRRRAMTRALKRLDRTDATARVDEVLWPPTLAGTGSGQPATIRGSIGSSWLERHAGLAWLVVGAMLTGLVFFASRVDQYFPPEASLTLGEEAPPPAADAASGRLLAAVEAPAGDGDYTFAMTQRDSDEPVTWDPCRPIHYVVRLGEAGSAGLPIVRDAVAQISRASGLKFVDDGETEELPTDDRPAYQPERYGERWAPVVIAWSSPDEEPRLSGDVAGLGGGEAKSDTRGHLTYVTGSIWLDTPALKPFINSRRARPIVQSTIVHELAHVLGAGHVSSEAELMHKEARVTKLGGGDRQGLALLGQGACVPGL